VFGHRYGSGISLYAPDWFTLTVTVKNKNPTQGGIIIFPKGSDYQCKAALTFLGVL
jgi:hypothetical protein